MSRWVDKTLKKLPPNACVVMAVADFEESMSLSAAMGLLMCIHGSTFPCSQCNENRHHNASATGKPITDAEFERNYTIDGGRRE